MNIPEFPDFAPICLDFKDELYPRLNLTLDGVSEFTFSNLYLFRKRYNYKLSKIVNKTYLISGEREGKSFFMTPCKVPEKETLDFLFERHDYWKNISDSLLCPHCINLEQWGITVKEDRDNFDYLYLRSDLAELSGKKYHKKRNLVNAFINSYHYEEQHLTKELIPDAMFVLDRWREAKGIDGDYEAAKEALELFEDLKLKGAIYYVDGEPAGWCMGETIAKGRMFVVHFEKGIEDYKGIYQFINQAFASSLPRSIIYVNREQDLGDEGLRQAKMSYRPCGFVKKYIGYKVASSTVTDPS